MECNNTLTRRFEQAENKLQLLFGRQRRSMGCRGAAQARVSRSVYGLQGAPELPARGRCVVDILCGAGFKRVHIRNALAGAGFCFASEEAESRDVGIIGFLPRDNDAVHG